MSFDKADLEKASRWLQEGKVKTVLFSEGTYQIEILDHHKSYWPFLQLADTGDLLDSFCTCAEVNKKQTCEHLAVAYLSIFHGQEFPLHVRFRDSIWMQLCLMASRRHGYDVDKLERFEGYRSWSMTGKLLFAMKPLNAEGENKLQEMIDKRVSETEETSLKFSNLSPEELALWRQGKPSQKLCFELSFWSDLAKWLMLLQEEGRSYTVEFSPDLQTLPQWMQISFDCVELGFYIARANWPSLLPSLESIQTPLPVHGSCQRKIEKMEYDPKQQKIFISFEEPLIEEISSEVKEAGVRIDGWKFIPNKGFFSTRVDPVFHLEEISKETIDLQLSRHVSLFRKHLQEPVHEGRHKCQYRLEMTPQGTLCIEMFVLDPGDFTASEAVCFGEWVYLPNKGFFQIEEPLFPEPWKEIPQEELGDFISRHKTWLNAFPGFQTHLMAIEPSISYAVNAQEGLSFSAQMDFAEDLPGVIDLGEWVFIPTKGFFPKNNEKMMPSLKAGLRIPSDKISGFIRTHEEELRSLSGFFTDKSPIEKMSLEVLVEGGIRVRPKYELLENYSRKTVLFFREYTYVFGEGFCEIPYAKTFLSDYMEEKVLTEEEEEFFMGRLSFLRPWISYLDPKATPYRELHLRVEEIKRDEASKIGQWVLQMQYETDLGQIPLHAVWEAIHQEKSCFFSAAGLIDLSTPQFFWLKNISKKRWLQSGKYLRLNALEWIRLQTMQDMKVQQGAKDLFEEFQSFQGFEPLSWEGLQSQLRPYQETGLKWLWFLYCYGLSGILCDEMGLGKTHQAMALLAAVKNHSTEPKRFLIVCPTSVIYHWEGLLKKFLPNLKVHVFYGQERKMPSENKDIVLTSYGVLRSEKKMLSEQSFDVAILDEIQHAKNTQSQTHRALKSLQVHVRIGLTGTPIENHILELKALFDIILPYYFPSDAQFKELFVFPIEKGQDPEKKKLLSRLIHPFVLRRKKQEVLLELPEKIEEIAYCDLSAEQRELYRQYFYSGKAEIAEELASGAEPIRCVHIFSLLSKLKQVCNHPCLVTKDKAHYLSHHSGKWDLFVELLQEARDSKQKIVIFTQYLDMMDIIEQYLTQEEIAFAEIRGSTRDRRTPVQRFQEDPSCEVFVASLQAAGVGIDLTAASVVIHYDRWWNPARENQATDRVHRMGQSHGVQVFKLVTKRTVEERIDELIQKKRGLLEELVQFDDQDVIKRLTKQELWDLVSVLEKDLEG